MSPDVRNTSVHTHCCNLHASTHVKPICAVASALMHALAVLYSLSCSNPRIDVISSFSLNHTISFLLLLLVFVNDTHASTNIILWICFYASACTSFSICHTKTVKSLFNFLSMLLLYSLGSQPVACTHRHTHRHTSSAGLKGDQWWEWSGIKVEIKKKK